MAVDADFTIVDFDLIDNGANIGATERDLTMADVFTHHA